MQALDTGLAEILGAAPTAVDAMELRWAQHARAASALGAAWKALGLRTVPLHPELCANTLSALYYPEGVDVSLVGRIRERGVQVAGGLHPNLRERYFRVGHMGVVTGQVGDLALTVQAVAEGLVASGAKVDPQAARLALALALDE